MWSGDFVYLRQGWSTSPRTTTSRRPSEGTPINSDAYAIPTNAQHPGTAMLFIDYLLRPEIAKKNMAYLYYPFPVKDAVPTFADLAKDIPPATSTWRTWRTPTCSGCSVPTRCSGVRPMWTEVKAS